MPLAIAQGTCLYLLRSGFSVGLRLAQLRYATLCIARFLARFARFARYAAFCIARLRGSLPLPSSARCSSSGISLLHSSLPPSLLAVAPSLSAHREVEVGENLRSRHAGVVLFANASLLTSVGKN